MPDHSVLTDPYLHEPKGISTSVATQLYVSDGLGSGAWKKIYVQGWEDINDSAAAQALTAGSWINLTNDGLGAFSNGSYRLPTKNPMWNTTLNQFEFNTAGLTLGDTIDLRVDVDFITVGANHVVGLSVDLGIGSPAPYTLKLRDDLIKTAGTYKTIVTIPLYMGDANTLNYPAKVTAFSDTAGDSVNVAGWFVRTLPMNPILA